MSMTKNLTAIDKALKESFAIVNAMAKDAIKIPIPPSFDDRLKDLEKRLKQVEVLINEMLSKK